jgi:hypothetical protein
MAELSEKQLFALLNVKHPLLSGLRQDMVEWLTEHTEYYIRSGEAEKTLGPSGAIGLMVNGGTAMHNPFRFTADFDISVIPPAQQPYSLPLARKGLSDYLDAIRARTKVSIQPMHAGADFYPQHYKEVAEKHGCIRYYVTHTLDASTLDPADGESLRKAIIESCKKTGCEPPEMSKTIPYVTLIDAGVDAVIPLLKPRSKEGIMLSTNLDEFNSCLAYMSPYEEGAKKYFAIMDESCNRSPMLFAKNLLDFYFRNYTENKGEITIPSAQFNMESGILHDLVRCLMPIYRDMDPAKFIPNFAHIDPDSKDNITRVKKGLKGLRDMGMISLEGIELEDDAKGLLAVAWQASQEIFGVSKRHSKHGDSYSIDVPDEVQAYWAEYRKMNRVYAKPYPKAYGEGLEVQQATEKSREHALKTADAKTLQNYNKLKSHIFGILSGEYKDSGLDANEQMAGVIALHVMRHKQGRPPGNFLE